ncbi:hypothetical protein PanWU01x14_141320 [Parasponia andersonii]|uniref:Uncharacterized protein n=1 Tax=Parasponia andersonii TaxID=3476 RepID=A0A2P5CLL3_PARAD|nr:hypothetical protein PanWU01x14_141320 [Parasponia andersonii]
MLKEDVLDLARKFIVLLKVTNYYRSTCYKCFLYLKKDLTAEIGAKDVEEKGERKLWADDVDGKDEDLIPFEQLHVSYEANKHNQAINNALFD